MILSPKPLSRQRLRCELTETRSMFSRNRTGNQEMVPDAKYRCDFSAKGIKSTPNTNPLTYVMVLRTLLPWENCYSEGSRIDCL